MTHEWARVAGRAAATFFAGWFGPWAAAGANAMITGYEVWLAGGSSEDIHKASAISFATSMAFNFVGRGVSAVNADYGAGAATAFKIVGHAAVGCASAEASGGECGQGALSAGFGAIATVASRGINPVGQFAMAVVAGGIGAELGGGKFANGALTAAMGYLMNALFHPTLGTAIHSAFANHVRGLGPSYHANAWWEFGGRPDAYNDMGEIWELKSNSAQTGPGYQQANKQLLDYIQLSGELYHRGEATHVLGPRLEVNLTVEHWSGAYDVSIRADINGTDTGLLFYNYERKACSCSVP